MKKFPIFLGVLIFTFAAGVGCVAIYYFGIGSFNTTVAELPEMLPIAEDDCQRAVGFPGVSVPVSLLKRTKGGGFPINARGVGANEISNAYIKYLQAMDEPYLPTAANGKDEIYRFLWLRTFHHPVVVTIERTGANYTLSSKESDGAGGYEPGKIIETHMRPLSSGEWCLLRDALATSDFWNMSVVDEKLGGLDGSEWILEGIRNGRYHAVKRWSPESGKYFELGSYLLALSGRSKESLAGTFY